MQYVFRKIQIVDYRITSLVATVHHLQQRPKKDAYGMKMFGTWCELVFI